MLPRRTGCKLTINSRRRPLSKALIEQISLANAPGVAAGQCRLLPAGPNQRGSAARLQQQQQQQ